MYAYHVTTYKKSTRILNYGLVPKIGIRSSKLEKQKAIYLFKTYSDVENALMNWLGDEFEENERLSLLKVNIPKGAIVEEGVEYELVVLSKIPAKNITLIKDDI